MMVNFSIAPTCNIADNLTHHQLFWLLTRWNCQDLLPWSASYQRGWAISSTTGCLMQTLQFRYQTYALPAIYHCSPGAYMIESLLLWYAISHNKLMHIVKHTGTCPPARSKSRFQTSQRLMLLSLEWTGTGG